MAEPGFWHSLVTEKSWQLLQEIHKEFSFVLIGGWAVFLYTRSLKSKDIDIIVDYDALNALRHKFPMTKNDRLKKYEIRFGEVDVDIYVPHFSNPGLPAEIVLQHTQSQEGFQIPLLEDLFLMKEKARFDRQGSPKGEKDGYDLISLLVSGTFDWPRYLALAKQYAPDSPARLEKFLQNTYEALPLNLNRHQFTRLKRQWLAQLG